MGKLLYGVNTGSLEQFGELRADSADAVHVGVVGPFENEFLRNAGSLCKLFPALWSSAFLKKFLRSADACCNEFFGVGRSDAFYIDNLVSHSCQNYWFMSVNVVNINENCNCFYNMPADFPQIPSAAA